MKKKIIIFLLIITSVVFLVGCTKNYDSFAKCLSEKNIKIYGTCECHFCKIQKNDFGDSFVYVDYVECLESCPNPQKSVCREKNLEGYPSWEIDGVIVSGRIPLDKLSELSGCPLEPEE